MVYTVLYYGKGQHSKEVVAYSTIFMYYYLLLFSGFLMINPLNPNKDMFDSHEYIIYSVSLSRRKILIKLEAKISIFRI